ncbi:MAG TPA: hypothetical protein VJT80_00090 [Steroidobacteraceae bacterium]|jgi:hypothetical protein|nr:hypothetical protein [Steroidobacteraceae bacterium]
MGPCAALALLLVYRCTVGGVATYSDRPCGPEAVEYQPDTSRVSTYDPPPASPTATAAGPARSSPTRRRGADGQDQVRHAAACERIHNGLKDIAAHMRSGYSAKQGERLRERKAKLEQQRRAQKCR